MHEEKNIILKWVRGINSETREKNSNEEREKKSFIEEQFLEEH